MVKRRLKMEWLDGLALFQISNKKGELLGDIYYDEDWNAMVWKQNEDIIITWDCWQEIGMFLKEADNRDSKGRKGVTK